MCYTYTVNTWTFLRGGPFSMPKNQKGAINMKFCPYCGADLLDENVLFCSNCGKKLPPHEAGITEPLTEEMRPEPEKTPKAEPSTKYAGGKYG